MNPYLPLFILLAVFGALALFFIIRSIRIVPAKTALVVERLGKYVKTLEAGIHLLVPFIDKVKFKHNLKEQTIDVPAQECFTSDNVKVRVDGVLYMKVVDPKQASYGITDCVYATIQLAQTTMRSVIGRLELDKTFEERNHINAEVVKAVDEASDPWGVKVSRYEIQNINVSQPILEAMEVQMKAEREKRAAIAKSQGDMESNINYSEAAKEEAINQSEGEKQRRINQAQGQAQEILSMARATAAAINQVAEAIQEEGGENAAALQLTEQYIDRLKALARKETRLILPIDINDMQSVMNKIEKVVKLE
jgi:regulator of protease activity HflC (stomatin/prohibitin superfamily)